MPTEPLPWDRRESFFKEQKHERGPSFDGLEAPRGGGGSSTPRWRDPYYTLRRLPPSYHLYEKSPTRFGGCERFWLEDEKWHSGGRNQGGPFRRSPYYETMPLHSTRDRECSFGSVAWKPMKWGRQGSINSLRTGRSEVEEVGMKVPESNSGKNGPVKSLVCSPERADDGLPRKKPRLGWGQGLAKYEKQKVEGSANSGKEVSETSPKIVGMFGSMSPATPCYAACTSPGVEDRPFSMAACMQNDTLHLSDSPDFGSKSYRGELSINTDHLPHISTLTLLLSDLLQSEDAFYGDSTFTRNAAMNKLLLFKAGIANELEKTECEIDSFDNEFKSLIAAGRSVLCHSSVKLQNDGAPISCLRSAEGSLKMSLNFTPGLSSAMRGNEELILLIRSLHQHDSQVKDAGDSIPRLLKSDVGESGSLGKETSGTVIANSIDCAVNFENTLEAEHSMPNGLERKKNENNFRHENKLVASGSHVSCMIDGSSHGRTSEDLLSLIMASNRDSAKRASEVFDKALPSISQHFDIWALDRILLCRKNDTHVKENLALHKHQLILKERILTLKFRAFHHLWKENLRLLSVRKQRPKSQKHLEPHNRSSRSGSQKHRSSVRSRFMLPAGNLTLVPTADIVDFTTRLLSDSHIKMFRSNLKMPALILDEKERRSSVFITKNSLVEDPPFLEKERAIINPWTQEEKRIFMEMLATFGKDFTKISSFLSHKTTADCIEFYYKNHKFESFRGVKKQLDSRKQWQCIPTNTYLVTKGKKWNREENTASLDMLGAVSVIAAHENGGTRNHRKCAGRTVLSSFHSPKVPSATCGSFERVNSVEISGLVKETTAADVLAGICCTLASEAVSSSVTSSVSPSETMNYVMLGQSLTPGVTHFSDEDNTCSDEGCGELLDPVDWTDEEKSIFIRALRMYGKDFAKVSHCVGTKTREQCKIFFSKARKCLGLDMIQPAAGNVEIPIGDANGGGSTADAACAVELDSAICSTQSSSKMDVDFNQSALTTSCEGFVHAGNTPLEIETDLSNDLYELRESYKEVEEMFYVKESTLNFKKLETGGENHQPVKSQEVDNNTLSCNGADAEGRESIKVESNHVCSC